MNFGSFHTQAMQQAAERAGLAQTAQADLLFRVAVDLESGLADGEFVLEIAETTAPGFQSLAAVTNRRFLIGAGPGSVHEIPLTSVTGWREVSQPTLGLELSVFDSRQVVSELGPKGIARLQHALAWQVQRGNGAAPATG